MHVLILTILSVIIVFIGYMQHPKFGKRPKRKHREKLKQSANYQNGRFQNQEHTPSLKEGYNFLRVLREYLSADSRNRVPVKPIPSIKTNLKNIPADKDFLVWFGHSSYLVQLSGKIFLVDPVFSNHASPVPGTNKAFKGSNAYRISDLPHIDYLLITHDHYDHLDYHTVRMLRPQVDQVITGLGVGAHLKHWGYPEDRITEKDWNESMELDLGIRLSTTPSRHFSGRKFARNKTLWLSYVLESPAYRIFIGGDSGYGAHFKKIGEQWGPFDLAILENGQYNMAWHYIHMLPEEVISATRDLNARFLLPVHSSKFALSTHPWDEPLNKIHELSADQGIDLLTPRIGEIVFLDKQIGTYDTWWKSF